MSESDGRVTQSETEDIDTEDASDRSGKSRGKGRGGAIMEGMQSFLSAAAKDRKAQMDMMRESQKQKEDRWAKESKEKDMKEFRNLAAIIGKELAWEQVFDEPFPTPRFTATSNNASSSSIPLAANATASSSAMGDMPIDPALTDPAFGGYDINNGGPFGDI